MSTTSTSYLNTPQAKDDSYALSEDSLIQYFNVLSNDLGGSAKTLWAITDGTESTLTSAQVTDLLSRDAAGLFQTSSQGAKVWITANGQIGYDATNTTFATELNKLSEGQTLTDTVTYSIRLANGTLSFATMTVTFTGTNDAPVAQASTAAVLEDGSVTGKVIASDVDNGAVLTYTLKSGQTLPVGLTFNGDGTYTFDAASYDSLAKDEKEVITVTYVVTDQFGASSESTLTITITGTNDAPVITSDTQSGDVAEDGTQEATGQIVAGDVDNEAVLTFSYEQTGGDDLGTFSVDEDGKWTFQLDNAAVQSLAKDEEVTVTYTVTVTDEHGATDTQDVTITITGTNDAPVITSDTQSGDVAEDGTQEATGQIVAGDVDNEAVLAFSYEQTGGDDLGTFSVGDDGKWTFTLDNAAVQSLAKDEEVTVTYTVTVTDEHDATDTQDVTITITGTNDAPTIVSSVAVDNTVTEDLEGDASGKVTAEDVDGDTLTFTAALKEGETDYGTFDIDNDGNWTFQLDNAAVQSLAKDEEVTVTYTVTVTDEHGATDTQDVTITITGTNDAPVITSATQAATVTEDGATQTASGQVTATDIDGDTLTYSYAAQGEAAEYGTFTLNADTGAWEFVLANGSPKVQGLTATTGATAVFTVTASDGLGGTISQDVTITINGANEPVTTVTTPTPSTALDPVNDFDQNLGGNATPNATGTTGNDTLVGNGTGNTFDGGSGNDVIYGRGDGDSLSGGTGNDQLYGQAGNDTLVGGGDADVLYGGSGGDTLVGAGGNDTIIGGSGNDQIFGDDGLTVTGTSGNDRLVGGFGADTVTGGAGADQFVFTAANDTGDVITDFNRLDGDKIALVNFGFDAADFGGTTARADGFWYSAGTSTSTFYVDTDGNTATAELSFTVNGTSFVATDFIFT
jgi:VCBS repeat-containing protein